MRLFSLGDLEQKSYQYQLGPTSLDKICPFFEECFPRADPSQAKTYDFFLRNTRARSVASRLKPLYSSKKNRILGFSDGRLRENKKNPNFSVIEKKTPYRRFSFSSYIFFRSGLPRKQLSLPFN